MDSSSNSVLLEAFSFQGPPADAQHLEENYADVKRTVRLLIIPKKQLSAYQLGQVTMRIFAPEHASDVGPQHFWKRPEHDERHLVLFDRDSEEFVGTVSCHITPPVVQDFTWWFDSRMRNKGYWRALADDLAAYLKTRHRIEKIGFIVFGRGHRTASEKIAKRLRDHFEKKPRSRPRP